MEVDFMLEITEGDQHLDMIEHRDGSMSLCSVGSCTVSFGLNTWQAEMVQRMIARHLEKQSA